MKVGEQSQTKQNKKRKAGETEYSLNTFIYHAEDELNLLGWFPKQ